MTTSYDIEALRGTATNSLPEIVAILRELQPVISGHNADGYDRDAPFAEDAPAEWLTLYDETRIEWSGAAMDLYNILGESADRTEDSCKQLLIIADTYAGAESAALDTADGVFDFVE